jgi:transcriptional regulator of acetoin/glycerol metabolism
VPSGRREAGLSKVAPTDSSVVVASGTGDGQGPSCPRHSSLGRFELAEGGTIFVDELGELPVETQIALLRVLREHEFERVGGNRSIRTDVQMIAAAN